ncbi:MarR family winged helix-turn-helix transcriptional regulator [Leptolyngbya sp. FACHB-261]|uniref:MarR family winged helix-turn-helix transcriptional regulator n=1 Tax=Leptolyngbya sp. FACHB-261 TaxID=2692806 RepID=UPI0016862DDA|nr:MarR family transcriptional regulator [Leptolyngbya sp. FACHB-261]MBD2102636.1 MarR family transcriptional regulator [Leptolyngbya sp. FACHB-261]
MKTVEDTIQDSEIIDQSAAQAAAEEPFIPTMRELVRTYQAFANCTVAHVRQLGLTSPQFDVVATLGNTEGMTMNKLAERTLVTKGTLTGIVDRLEEKGLVRREVPADNRRCFRIVLTAEGERVFAEVFPLHVAYLKERFGRLSLEELEQLRAGLERLREQFSCSE